MNGKDEWQIERFITPHPILLAVKGIPALYIHSFLGTENDDEKVEATQLARSITRHHWQAGKLENHLNDDNSTPARILPKLTALIGIRKKQAAFHPNATQFTLHITAPIFAFWKQSMDRRQRIFCLNNISHQTQIVALASINLVSTDHWRDLISDARIHNSQGELILAPYQTLWLSNP